MSSRTKSHPPTPPTSDGVMRRGLIVAAALLVTAATIVLVERQPDLRVGRFVECLAVALFLGVAAWASRGVARNAIIASCSFLFGLAALEGGVLIVESGLWQSRTQDATARPVAATHDAGLVKSRPVVGWGPAKPGVFRVFKRYPDGKLVFDTHVTIDASLNRKTIPSADRGDIAFFGDSFVFGDGLDDDATLPQAFADLEGGKIPVLNLAFSGWSPAQNLAALQAGLYEPLLHAPRRFILFTTPFHLERTACKGAYAAGPSPRFVLVDGKLVNQGPCASAAKATLIRFARRFALYDRLAPAFSGTTRRDVETYLAIVEAFVATAEREYHVGTTILFKMDDEDYLRGTGYTQAMLIDALRRSGADVLVEALPPIADPPRYVIQGDGHPTGLANKALAVQIEDHLRAVDPAALDVARAPRAAP